MNKFYKMFLLVCIFTLAIPLFVSAEETNSDVVVPYGLGVWDYLGQENIAFAYTKQTISKTYIATDGANFKIDITSTLYPSSTVSASITINGQFSGTGITTLNNYKGTIQFSGVPAGAQVQFFITVSSYDTINFKFYD